MMGRGGRTVLLCRRGRTITHTVTLETTVKVEELPLRAWWHPEEFGLRYMLLKGEHYPVPLAVEKLRSIGRDLGITEGALRLLDYVENLVPRNRDADTKQVTSSPAAAEQAAPGQEERLPTQAQTSEA